MRVRVREGEGRGGRDEGGAGGERRATVVAREHQPGGEVDGWKTETESEEVRPGGVINGGGWRDGVGE